MSVLEEANSYIRDEVRSNNERILALLQAQWHLVDTDDMEIFSTFNIDMSRLKRLDEGSKVAFVTHKHIGPVSFMRQEFIDRVKSKYSEKRQKIKTLT